MVEFERQKFDGPYGGGLTFEPFENGYNGLEFQERIDAFVTRAKKDAIERTNGSPEAIRRVEETIENRFRPYIIENEIIAHHISTPEYQASVNEVDDYLQGRIASIACDDGRITNDQIGGPRVMTVSRRLQGMPEVRQSTKDRSKVILDDPDIISSLKIYIDRQKKKGNNDPFITEFVGPHIFSTSPTHGCGYEMAKIRARGGSIEVGMWDGGINDYFNEIGNDGFEAFNNTIEMLGGRGATFDTVHDAYSQGLIFGLKDARDKFDPQKTLRQNLIELAHKDEILMTELLDERFYQRIMNKAAALGYHDYVDLDDLQNFGTNSMMVRKIALEIAKEEEAAEESFSWIPNAIKTNQDARAVRALGFTAIRNVVRRVVGNIQKGNHNLLEHPEQLIRIGPIGADFNGEVIPFIHHTASGRHHSADMNDVATLCSLLEQSLKNFHNVNLANEARLILTTGIFDRSRYVSSEVSNEVLEEINSVVGGNASKIRDRFAKGVENGEIVVLGCLHEPKTRSLTHIVK